MSYSIPSNAKLTTDAAFGAPHPHSHTARIRRVIIGAILLVSMAIQVVLLVYQLAVHPLADYSGRRDMSLAVFVLKRLTPLLVVGSSAGYVVFGIALIVFQVGFLYMIHRSTESLYRKWAGSFVCVMVLLKISDLVHDKTPDGVGMGVAIVLGAAAGGPEVYLAMFFGRHVF
ncbi:hypothetical protein AMAG_11622 [Allomyces macrogynus ATCC 38327]|uniref:Uncharacterized protein n=1 Tax=Allomyces macrogynus (strain ATCC 38327) TaxID=578462 RepID=A0A0L0SVY3_ALLM3|nr:hypothetical protein AMAG_11622 [Allomyces macrogynus ATCC 38327]|eukprot:KNE66484.1 hypothetical protein AMAG_11622 [Allomyces macrogynus ATCC 38327]